MSIPNQNHADLVLERLTLLPQFARACNARMGHRLSPSDLDEVVQEASLTTWSSRDEFRGEGSVEAWMYGIVRISILRFLSAQRRRREREVPITEKTESPIDGERSAGTVADSGFRLRVREALRSAGTNIEEIFVGHEIDGKTFAAISEGLEMKETRVKSKYYRCIPSLKIALEKLWNDLSGV